MKSLVAAIATVAALTLAGCSYVNPITTQEYYAASDGVHLNVDDVEAQNLIVFTTGEGEPAALTGTIVNRGNEDMTLEVAFDNANATTIEIPARQSIALSPVDAVEVLGTSPVVPGELTQVVFLTADGGNFSYNIPVMDGTLPQYEQIVEAIG